MTSVVLVHGTGVRAPSYDKTFDRVSRGLAGVRPDVRTVPCFWGDAHGASLALDGASLPLRAKDRGWGGEDAWDVPPAEDDPLAVWALLEADPLAELRAFAGAAADGEDATGFVPGRRDPWDEVADQVRELTLADGVPGGAVDDGEGLRQLAADLAPYTGEAADRVAEEISNALGGAPFADGIEPVAARAVLALALRLAESAEAADEPLPVDGADRDALVRLLTERLGGGDRGVAQAAKWTGARLLTPVLWPLSSAARWQRGRLTGAIVPAGGDILRYQARGEGLRTAIAEAVRGAAAAAPGPVVLLAHSLGGIACVDLFADGSAGPPPGVDLLVTVGSQAPFLYELDALGSLRRGEPLPAAFPRWINVYDERDLLAFVGERTFPGRVADVRVDTRQPFPRSHSAYFAHRGLYDLLAAELPR
ncbi:hypothetical protein AB0C96_30705 [Streptomyces sp. NPDC048506]|uniref:hypothetical protein n=1 Tax=Streptomyces sp. NPDC048506 TaxID=3155028 RepID=UPI0034392E93